MGINEIKQIIEKYFYDYPINIGVSEIITSVIEKNISIEDLDYLMINIRENIDLFEANLGHNGMQLSNLFRYAVDAKYIEPNKWKGSKNRNRITKEFKTLLRDYPIGNYRDISVNKPDIAEALDELNSLIGLQQIKKEINDFISIARISKEKIKFGITNRLPSLHMVFSGNPGTGKTTVARLIGTIYQALELLEKGQLIEVSRKDLVGQYIGHTAQLVDEKIKKAEGGVLFIDEAYSLARTNDTRDFGHEAIETLIKAMEDNRKNLAVIVAGYPMEMENFINMNPGLKSRFTMNILFEDYSSSELIQIFKKFLKEDGHILTDSAEAKLSFLLIENGAQEGNARYVRNLYEKVQKCQAVRLGKHRILTIDMLKTIEDIDIPNNI